MISMGSSLFYWCLIAAIRDAVLNMLCQLMNELQAKFIFLLFHQRGNSLPARMRRTIGAEGKRVVKIEDILLP